MRSMFTLRVGQWGMALAWVEAARLQGADSSHPAPAAASPAPPPPRRQAAQAGGDQGFAPGPGGKWLVLTVQYRGEQRTTITREADGQVVAELR